MAASRRDRLLRWLIGKPGSFLDRVVGLAILVCVIVLAAAAYWALSRGIEPRATSSYPVLRVVFWVVFNEWFYAGVVLFVTRKFWLKAGELMARVAAEKTGFETQTINRLAEEAKSSTGGTVVLAESGDSHAEISDRIDRKLDGEGDDQLHDYHAVDADADGDVTDAVDTGEPVAQTRTGELLAEIEDLNDRIDELADEADSMVADVLDADISAEKVLQADDMTSMYEVIEDEDQELVDEFDSLVEEIEALEAEREELIEEAETLFDEQEAPATAHAVDSEAADVDPSEDAGGGGWRSSIQGLLGRPPRPIQYAMGLATGAGVFGGGVIVAEVTAGLATVIYHDAAAMFLIAAILGAIGGLVTVWLSRRRAVDDPFETDTSEDVDDAPPAGDAADEDVGDQSPDESKSDADVAADPYADDSWERHWKETMLRLQTHLSLPEIAWNVGIPALTIFGALILAGGIWVQWWAALGAGALGISVGLLNWRRVHGQRERRLRRYRDEWEPEEDNLVGFQVKHVDVSETERYYAYFPRHTYATDDREEFVTEVAQRAYEKAHGLTMSPSILEKYARQDRERCPNIDDFHDQELGDIMHWLTEEVSSAGLGIVAKQKLIEDCVEHDRSQRWHQKYQTGYGYDPRLVRQAYELLVDAGYLIEDEVVLQATDENGDPLVATGVSQRNDPVPVSASEIRAEFTTEFMNYAQWEPLYEMPDVSHILDRPPLLADKAGPDAAPLRDDVAETMRPEGGASSAD